MVIPFEWETIDDSSGIKVYRAKVIGGWLVRVSELGSSTELVFVADELWDWELS